MKCSVNCRYRLALAVAFAPASALAADVSPYANLVQSRYVHCAFSKSYDRDPATGDRIMVEGRSQSLTHFQGIRDGSARQISTQTAGARNVKVVNGRKYLHFVDAMAGMYVLTTVYGCLDRDARNGACVTYGATQSRHFDPRALTDPDAVYEAMKAGASPGFCDHSFVNMEAATTK